MITKIIDFWWEWLAAMTLQVSLLIILIGVICFFWRKVSARVLYFLWLLILVKLIVPPDLGHKYSVSNILAKSKGVLQYATTLPKRSQEYTGGRLELSVPEMSSGFLENLTLVEMANMNFGVDTKSLPKVETQRIASLQMATPYIKHLINSIPYKHTLFVIWLLGIIGFLISMVLNLRRFHRWLLICGQESPRWLEEKIADLSGEIGIKKSPQCIIIPDTFSPCVFGWFKPKLLFPKDLLTQLNSEQLRMAILHELIHIKRRDTIISGMQSLIQFLYWFNPLIWIAGREIRHHREMAVDEVVVATQNDLRGHNYQNMIIALSEKRALCSMPSAVGILEPRSFMFRRIVRLLDFSSNTISRRSSIFGYLMLLLFAVIMIPMGITQPDTAQFEKEKIKQKGVLENLNESQKLYVEWTEKTFAQLLDESRYKNFSDIEKAKLEEAWLKIIQEGPFDYKYYEAINGLGIIKSREAVKPLLKIATERQEKNNRDRWMAVRTLGMIGDKSVVPELIHLIYHYNQNTRFWTQISLVRLTGVNFSDDWKKWGEWWNSKAIVVNLPACSFEKIEWTTNSEWADPQKQKENDIAFIEKLKAGRKEGSTTPKTLQTQEPSQKEKVNYLGQTNFPKVVELDPPNEAKDVDPNREYITVTFNRQMRNGYSWVDKGKRPPLDKIEWINNKQCRAWVKLEPNKEYGVWLNFGPNTSKFRSAEGVSADRVYWSFQTKAMQQNINSADEIKPSGNKSEIGKETTISSLTDSPKIQQFKNLLKTKISVDADKSPDGQAITVQYAVIAICEKAGVPYQWEKSKQLASPECRQFIASVHIKDIPAEKVITDILAPVKLGFDIDNNGLYLCKPMKNGAEKQLIGKENLEHYTKLKKYPFQDNEQWKSLSKEEQEKVIKGVQDLEMIEKALIAFWERNQRTPNNLEELCPEFLDELPNDPFATDETKGKPAAELGLYSACNPSNNGSGYYYAGYGIYDAWIVQSMILPKFESRGLNIFPLGICHPGKRGGFSGGTFRPKQ